MGCAASKVENEDTVRRCKERRRLMKEAVSSRHQLASAHSDYLRSLRLTAAALSRFAAGEPFLSVSDHTPPILLPSISSFTNPHYRPPPPPPEQHYPPPILSSPSMASSKLPHILSAPPTSNPSPNQSFRKPQKKKPSYKLPHILSESSFSPTSQPPKIQTNNNMRTNSFNFTATPSSSSAWDWENFYPPSPPDSEFFCRRKEEAAEEPNRYNNRHHLKDEEVVEEYYEEEEEEEDEEVAMQGEEIPCTEWEDEHDHYASTTTSETRSDILEEEEEMRARAAARSGYECSAPSEIASGMVRPIRREPSVASSSVTTATTAANETRIVVRHQTLAEIVAAIEEYFVKAAAAGDGVSEFLEAGRAQFDRNFRQLKKTVYHSNSVLSALSSTWSSKPPLAIRYKLDTNALEMDTAGGKSHGSTLERLLAWEKKLYEEVKARESVKIDHEKKLSTLQSQECRGKDDAKLDKTKASIRKLQSLIIVTSQAVTTTSSAIIRVRDNELAPQLVDMCFALLSMWRSMNQFHEVQNNIVQQVRGLVNRSTAESTSDLHRLATRDLEAAVSAWHSNFIRLIKFQRDYIRSLYGWLKLTLFQVSNDTPQNDCSSPISLELTAFCDEWKQALDRLPDTVASEAIKSFVNVIHVIYTKQAEELKIKKRAEAYSKELEKKAGSLRAIEKKYYQSYSMVGIGLPGSGRDDINGQVFDARDPLAEKKSEIALCRRKVEDEMTRHAKAIEVTRSMTLNNIQTGLPGVFQAMSGFSGMFVEALEVVCRRAGSVR